MNIFLSWLPVSLEKELSLILRDKCRQENYTAAPGFHTCPYLCLMCFLQSVPRCLLVPSRTHKVIPGCLFKLQTEKPRAFIWCLSCVSFVHFKQWVFFFNIRSLLNPGFKAIFIQYEMCMERRHLEIEDSAVCFSSRSHFCLGEVKLFSGKPRQYSDILHTHTVWLNSLRDKEIRLQKPTGVVNSNQL